jgi:hypothetical protein
MTDQPITIESALRQVTDQLEGPTTLSDIVQRVLEIRPSQAKNPTQSIRTAIRYQYDLGWAWLDEQTIIPLRLSMRGVRFRITPSQTEFKHGILLPTTAFQGFLARGVEIESVQFVDTSDRALPSNVVNVEEEHRSTFMLGYSLELQAFGLEEWFRRVDFQRKDSILVTIEDWETARYRLEREPVGKRRHSEITQKNQELADLFFEVLEHARRDSIYDTVAVQSVYARMPDPGGYPGDHWTKVVEQDPRMKWRSGDIRYADSMTVLESLFQQKPVTPKPRVNRQQAQQVFRFKATLKHRSDIWRRIEIQGKQTLNEFDRILRNAFEHNSSDHLSGFWKRIRRGGSGRFREVDLGSINPFGGGEAADIQISDLELQPGDQLKYVYDFGDWIEHTIIVEEIVEPEADASYPRIVAQNKPRYRYCQRCKGRGRKTIATRVCAECTQQEGVEVLLCIDCEAEEHEDHYVVDKLY